MDLPAQRAALPRLLAQNPNYFGNLAGSELAPVTTDLADTSWEQLIGVGFSAARGELEATFEIKQDSGYGGGLCTAGSWEYVQFWVNAGAGWQSAGLAGVNVHDLPAGEDCTGASQLPVSYIARLAYRPPRNICSFPVLPQVRAILSWSVPPPTSGAAPEDWQPAFGNVVTDHVQIPPRPFILADVLSVLDVQADALPASMAAGLDVPVPVPALGPLSVAELVSGYRPARPAGGTAAGQAAVLSVPAHRFGTVPLAAAVTAAAPDQQATAAAIAEWQDLGLDWSAAVSSLTALDGNTSYEQLDSLGLDITLPRLVATITIKRPAGYNGGLCTAGSTEYVAFWADLGPDCALTYLGTQQVSVHDIAKIPAGGLNYSAVLPVDLSAVQRPCSEPFLMRVRAVLSWAVPPSSTNPDALPYWGNRIDAHVQVPPLLAGAGTGPNIFDIGGIGVLSIDSSYNPVTQATSGTGLTHGGAVFQFTGIPTSPLPSPFGGLVTIYGAPVLAGSYRIQVRDLDLGPAAPWITVASPVTVATEGGATNANVAVGEYFSYLPGPENEFCALADWYPPAQGSDLWEIKLDARDAASSPLGEVRYRIQLDNIPPVVAIHIDSGGDCKKFLVGETIDGHVYAADPEGYPGAYSIWVEPSSLPGGTGTLAPASPVAGQTGPEPGDPWSLDTAGMSPCAYTVQVQARNRVIMNSGTVGSNSPIMAVGFSLGLD
jgi:hypothetical protein